MTKNSVSELKHDEFLKGDQNTTRIIVKILKMDFALKKNRQAKHIIFKYACGSGYTPAPSTHLLEIDTCKEGKDKRMQKLET